MILGISTLERPVIDLLERSGGALVETFINYESFKDVSLDAMRKRVDRMVEKNILIKSKLASGRPLVRLSQKTATQLNAGWLSSQTHNANCEAVAVSSLGHRTDQYLFPTSGELQRLLAALTPEIIPQKIINSRFVLCPTGVSNEFRLNRFISEAKPPSEILRRVEVANRTLSDVPIFKTLESMGLFGFVIAVPNDGLRAALEGHTFPVAASVVVVEELIHLFS